MGQKVQKVQSGFDLVRRGDRIALLPHELMVGTVVAVRGGDHDGLVAAHRSDGWTINERVTMTWFELFRLVFTAPDVEFEVTDAPRRCAWALCSKTGWLEPGAPENKHYCSDSCRTLASRDRRS